MLKKGRAVVVRWLILLVLAVGLTTVALADRRAAPEACDLGEAFVLSSENWDQAADDLLVDYAKYGFKFTDKKKRILGCAAPTVSLLGVQAAETRFFFAADRSKIERMEFSLCNRGEAEVAGKILSMEDLKQLLATVSERLSADGKVPKTVSRKIAGGMTYSRAWPKRDPAAELLWGVSGDKEGKRAEFATLRLSRGKPSAGKSGPAGKPTAGTKAGSAANVKRTDEGDVYIANVPMVDQGRKGYCSVAAAERVLRYYGNDVSEHEIAQMAGSSGTEGTDVASMIAAVETIGKKCGLGKTEVVSNMRSWDDVESRLAKYNQAAKKLKRPELSLSAFITQKGNMRTLHVGDLEQAMEPKVLKAMAMKDGAGYKRFLAGVKAQVDQGLPLFWGVRLGVYPEPECPQAAGGHMRLVVGYNAEAKEILYSDTWGAGHELKHIPQDWAWTITASLFYLKPRR